MKEEGVWRGRDEETMPEKEKGGAPWSLKSYHTSVNNHQAVVRDPSPNKRRRGQGGSVKGKLLERGPVGGGSGFRRHETSTVRAQSRLGCFREWERKGRRWRGGRREEERGDGSEKGGWRRGERGGERRQGGGSSRSLVIGGGLVRSSFNIDSNNAGVTCFCTLA